MRRMVAVWVVLVAAGTLWATVPTWLEGVFAEPRLPMSAAVELAAREVARLYPEKAYFAWRAHLSPRITPEDSAGYGIEFCPQKSSGRLPNLHAAVDMEGKVTVAESESSRGPTSPAFYPSLSLAEAAKVAAARIAREKLPASCFLADGCLVLPPDGSPAFYVFDFPSSEIKSDDSVNPRVFTAKRLKVLMNGESSVVEVTVKPSR